jgi:hypothetical protein
MYGISGGSSSQVSMPSRAPCGKQRSILNSSGQNWALIIKDKAQFDTKSHVFGPFRTYSLCRHFASHHGHVTAISIIKL